MSIKSHNRYTISVGIIPLLIALSTTGMEIKKPSLMVPARLGNIRLFHKDNGFIVEHDGEKKNIQSCWVDPILRNANPDRLRKLLNNGYIQVNELKDKNNNIDYKLDAHGRLNGGWIGSYLAIQAVGRPVAYGIIGLLWISAWATGGATTPIAIKATGVAATGGVETVVNGVASVALVCPFLP